MTDSAPRSPYGPNTPAVRRFLQRFAALGSTERDAAAAAFEAAEHTPAFRRAERVLAGSLTAAGREGERDAALRPLAELVRASPREAPARAEADAEPALDPVAPAAVAAVLALLMRDLLPADVFETLYAPLAPLVPADRTP